MSVFSGLVIISLYYTFVSYHFQINAFIEIETTKLTSIANTVSKSVSSEDIQAYYKSNNGHKTSTAENELYLKYFHLFRDVKRENKLNSDIITLKYDSINHYFLNGFSSSYKKGYSDNIIMPDQLEKTILPVVILMSLKMN